MLNKNYGRCFEFACLLVLLAVIKRKQVISWPRFAWQWVAKGVFHSFKWGLLPPWAESKVFDLYPLPAFFTHWSELLKTSMLKWSSVATLHSKWGESPSVLPSYFILKAIRNLWFLNCLCPSFFPPPLAWQSKVTIWGKAFSKSARSKQSSWC